jgi:hypothetical protein
VANDPHFQSIRRAIIAPLFQAPDLETEVHNIEKSYSQLAQEVIQCHNRVYIDQIAVPALSAFFTVILPAPYPDTFYSPLCILDWNAYGYVSGITANNFTITFSAAAPAITGGTMRLIVIR